MPRLTNFPNGISSFGIPIVGSAPLAIGPFWFVNGSATGNGTGGSLSQAFTTIQRAVNAAASHPGSAILIAPGSYNETVTISRPSGGSAAMFLCGMGPRGSVGIAPSTTNAGGLVNDADDVTLINVGCAANGSGTAVVNTGSRLHAYSSKFENDDGTGLCMQLLPGTVAQRAAHTKGSASDCFIEDCEFAWAAAGLRVTGTDYGAVTELYVRGCRFHDLDTSHISESVGSGGSAAVTYADLEIENCIFSRNESGAEPTNYILLNASNANNGIVTKCAFPTALAGGKNLVSTALLWTSNYHTGGISTGQPS